LIDTGRLILRPLTYGQVAKFRNLNNELEAELGLNDGKRTISERYKTALEKYTMEWIKEDPENYLFATIWIIIDKDENVIVGDIGFKRKPNEKGEMEIGYAVQEHYQRKGYMSEAMKEILRWAFGHREVKSILAETRQDNKPSMKILLKNGFTELRRAENMIWWKVERS
jgi:ribosomal-protein-alanine N-acetyltransferase